MRQWRVRIQLSDELYHYGVKGMKWGIRKSEYKRMNRMQRKAVRKRYYETPEGQMEKSVKKWTYLTGPLGGAIALRAARNKARDVSEQDIQLGRKVVSKHATDSIRTESKRVSDIKSRVTGRKENGKPAFLMTRNELEEFSAQYEQRKRELATAYKNAKDSDSKARIQKQADRLEDDYLSVVEQDFWYSDD